MMTEDRGGPQSLAAAIDFSTRASLCGDCGRDGARPSRADGIYPSRKCPSKNSVVVPYDNRPIILFVSVNANGRQPVFDNDAAVACILSAWQAADNWLVGRYVVMPDHLHFFCAPAKSPVPDFQAWMTYWKRLVARTFPVAHETPLWQRECWDVQMRSADGYREKWNYIRNNPVRKGLVADVDEWKFQGFVNVLSWHDA